MFKLLWGITGAGYFLKESIDLMKELQERYKDIISITVVLSKEGAVVVKWYKQWLYLTSVIKNVKVEKTPNNPFLVGPLQLGKYDLFLTCPVSANSLAKIAHGIADSLITNCIAQGIKGGMPAYIFPTDQLDESIVTSRPNGSPLTLKIRDIELENIKKLKKMDGIILISNYSDIKNIIVQKINKSI